METIILFSLLSTALFYLGSRAKITSWLWSRYPKPVTEFMDCSACSGFWYGVLIAVTFGRRYDLTYLGLDPYDLWTPILVGLGSMTLTPIVGGLMQAGFEALGSVIGGSDGG